MSPDYLDKIALSHFHWIAVITFGTKLFLHTENKHIDIKESLIAKQLFEMSFLLLL